ncbi:hypothetical protein [Lactiplantibacillus plantarum]|uniref:hypothetical protein n=1 Tax=Lactiplantibacillus plantarum TaxID=1590 RepID=UPI001BADAF6A|nr:hypothetical protein [Lactiplantibacillus plantarum]MBS0954995.1 hypothetical protein [Lactiplantibacillus plantarum]
MLGPNRFEMIKQELPTDLRSIIEYQSDIDFQSNLNKLLEKVIIHSFTTLECYLILLYNDSEFWRDIQSTISKCKKVYEKYHDCSTKFRGYQLFRALELTDNDFKWSRCVSAIRFMEFNERELSAFTISQQLKVIKQISVQRELIVNSLNDKDNNDKDIDRMEAKYKQLTSWLTLMEPQGKIEMQ